MYANDAHPAGVSITKVEVENYAQGARWSPEHDCWVGTRPDFTGETMRVSETHRFWLPSAQRANRVRRPHALSGVENG